jgi:hypothetical protein
VADEPRTEYLAHDDGRWIEYTLDSLQQRALGPEKQGGLIVGRDPQCDIVIDDDEIEDFHVRLFGRGHHPHYIECIAGRAQRAELQLHPGDELRGGGTFAGWREATWNPDEASPELRAALAIARDAELEGRHADAEAIRVQAGYRRIHVPWRKALPVRLAQSEQLLRIRVEAGGTSQVYALGGIAVLEVARSAALRTTTSTCRTPARTARTSCRTAGTSYASTCWPAPFASSRSTRPAIAATGS